MSEPIPEDIRATADALWVRALNDGTPDAATMIAEALTEERERCAKVCEPSEHIQPGMARDLRTCLAAAIRRGTP